jgi:hypothetical protein
MQCIALLAQIARPILNTSAAAHADSEKEFRD